MNALNDLAELYFDLEKIYLMMKPVRHIFKQI